AEEVVAAEMERIELDRHVGGALDDRLARAAVARTAELARCIEQLVDAAEDVDVAEHLVRGRQLDAREFVERRVVSVDREAQVMIEPVLVDIGADAAGRLLDAEAQRQPGEALRELEREADLVL